jgi:hypothetical protein
MPPRAERSRFRLIGYAFLSVFVVMAALPAYLLVESSWRPFAMRLAGAAVVAMGCVRLVGFVRRTLEQDTPSALDVPPAAPRPIVLDERFLRLRDDLVFATQSRRYFDLFVWPRLQALGAGDTPPSEERRSIRRRRGPSLRTLESVIERIELRS